MKIKYWFVNGDRAEVEVDEGLGKFILESRTHESSRDTYHRRHIYSLEDITYEGGGVFL